MAGRGLIARARGVAQDPGAAWERFLNRMDRRVEYAGRKPVYRPEPNWEARLHERLGAPYPCPAAAEFDNLWPRIAAEVAAKGVRLGPASFYGWNDGDPMLARALWCLVRHTRPDKAVETGVAHGISSRVMLEAMRRNGAGRLWSIDPPPVEPRFAARIGIAVDDACRERWTLVRGTSRRQLPALLAELGRIGLFVHDSLHTKRNVCFEAARARNALAPGGFLAIDDIDTNWGWQALIERYPEDLFLVCQSEPVRPDTRRFDGKGLFGLIRRSG